MVKSRSMNVSPLAVICASRPPGAKGGAMQFFGQLGIVQDAQAGMAIRWFVNDVAVAPMGVLPQPAPLPPVRPLTKPPVSPPPSAPPLASASLAASGAAPPLPTAPLSTAIDVSPAAASRVLPPAPP